MPLPQEFINCLPAILFIVKDAIHDRLDLPFILQRRVVVPIWFFMSQIGQKTAYNFFLVKIRVESVVLKERFLLPYPINCIRDPVHVSIVDILPVGAVVDHRSMNLRLLM